MEFAVALCKAFKRIRTEKGLSKAQVVRRSRLSMYVVERIEKEIANPPADKLFMMAKGLGVRGFELIGLAEKIYKRSR